MWVTGLAKLCPHAFAMLGRENYFSVFFTTEALLMRVWSPHLLFLLSYYGCDCTRANLLAREYPHVPKFSITNDYIDYCLV